MRPAAVSSSSVSSAPPTGAGPLRPGSDGSLLLLDAEKLSVYMRSDDEAEKRKAIKALSWGRGTELLPALRRLLQAPQEERDLIKGTVDALLPPSPALPVHSQDPEVLKGKLWLQARLYALHEKAPITL